MAGVCMAGGGHGRGACVVGVCAWHGRHAWQGACMVGGMCGGGACMTGTCMAGGVHGGGHVWQGACMVGGMHGGGTHGGEGWWHVLYFGSIRMNILMLDTRNVEQTKDVRMYT